MASEFFVNRWVSNIHTVDANTLLSPQLMRQIVEVVLAEVENKSANDRQRNEDSRLDQGARRSNGGCC